MYLTVSYDFNSLESLDQNELQKESVFRPNHL